MKYFVPLAVIGLHLPQLLMAFTASVRTIQKQPIVARFPTTICNARNTKEGNANEWESSCLSKMPFKQVAINVLVSTITGVFMPVVAYGVSGGGLDFANLDISNQNFSGGNYKGKDFTQGSSIIY